MSSRPPPLPHSYWVEPGRLLAGEYPGGADEEATLERLQRLFDAGIDCFIDLTEPGELDPYEQFLPGPYSQRPVTYLRMPIPDHGLPHSAAAMAEILEELDAALDEGRRVYLHCRAGIGRTNLVVGCWFAAGGIGGDAALLRLNDRWRASARSASWPTVPETDAQSDYVRDWRLRRSAARREAPAAAPGGDRRDRFRGLLLGIAAGDALGQATRGRRPAAQAAPEDLAGGGPHALPPGAWSDKTAMALCLAESLAARGGFDAADLLLRLQSWRRDGRWTSTGTCIGASTATARALAQAQWTGNPYSGSHDPAQAEAEALARIGPAAAWHAADPRAAIEAAVNAARITHQAPLLLDCVRYLAALIAGALAGATREALLAPSYAPVPGLWETVVLKPRVHEVAAGSWRGRKPRTFVSGAHAAPAALELALWSFDAGRDFAGCLSAAAGRGGEADTNAAIAGALAGAFYGASALPAAWRAALARGDEIAALADALEAAAPHA